MDPRQFEVLSRRVGAAATRRGVLKVLAGGLGASVLALLRANGSGAQVEVEKLPNSIPLFHCRPTLSPCHDDRQCCSGFCHNNVTVEPAPDPIEVPLPPPLPDVEIPVSDTFEGVCDCRPRGATCYALVEGAFCCSGRCTNEAKCA